MIDLSFLQFCPSILQLPHSLEGKVKFITDTRKFIPGSAFVAIPGTRFNPLDNLVETLKQDCPLVVYQRSSENDLKSSVLRGQFPKTVFLPVRDSVMFLQELTHQHISQWKTKSKSHVVFAISGSNGKTTHKEMLSFILKSIAPHQVVSTEKNNNNHLGVPLTLLEVSDETEVVVLELGSNHPGEIKFLCDMAVPNAGLTTNIGATHLEFFGNEENVFKEEGYLYLAVKENTNGQGFYLINADDAFLKTLIPTKGSITFGEAKDAMAQVSYLEQGASIKFKGRTLTVKNQYITGKHNKLNLVTCAFIATELFPQCVEEIITAAASFMPTKNRSEWIEFAGRSVFLDAYNANPSSMMAALEAFKESVFSRGLELNEACVVLGDMNELGESAQSYHQQVGQMVTRLGFPHVYFVGRYADDYLKGCPYGNKRLSSSDFKSEYRDKCIKNYSIHFIKGSRSLQLESLLDIT